MIGVKMTSSIKDNKKENIILGEFKLEAHWRNITSGSLLSKALYIGRIKVVEYFYDGLKKREDKLKYKVTSILPTMKNYLGHYEKMEDAEAQCVSVAHVFCKQLQFGNKEN